MDPRAYASGASASPPTAPVSPSVGYPTAGNPATGTPPTKPGPFWYHQIAEELRAIIAAAGLTPDQETLTQLLTALRSAGVFTTPAQFDNTTKAATTEFVQRALGNFQGIASVTVDTVLTADFLGKAIYVGGTTNQVTVPDGSAAPSGGALMIHNVKAASGDITVLPSAGDTFSVDGGSIASLVIKPGDSATFYRIHSNIWYVIGTATLQHSYSFGKSLAASGYQKLPSGLIVQWWSNAGTIASAANLAIALPLTFPNNHAVSVAIARNGQTANAGMISALTTSTSVATVYNNGSAAINGCFGISIGY